MERKQIILQKLKKVITMLGKLLTTLSVIFVIYSLYKTDIDWGCFSNPYIICLYILGLSFFVVFYNCINSYVWKMYVEFFSGKKAPTPKVVGIYLKSNVAKYLPGNVIQYVGRNVLGKKLEIGQKSIIMATIAELLSIICGNIFFAFIMSLQNTKNVIGWLWSEHNLREKISIFIVLAILIIIICICCIIKYGYWEKISVYLKKELLLLLTVAFSLYFVVFLVSALVLWCITYILNIDLSYVDVASANALSWLAGYIVPGAPGGIGIREVVLVWLLEAKCLPELIMLTAVLVRICSIIGDFLSFLGVIIYEIIIRRKKN